MSVSLVRPTRALSVQQPWAFLLASGVKDVENRSWSTGVREWVWIHAGQRVDRSGMPEALAILASVLAGQALPSFEDLPTGGIVGMMEIVGCVSSSPSPWFFGPYGLVVSGARAVPFHPCRGALGFFAVDYPVALWPGVRSVG